MRRRRTTPLPLLKSLLDKSLAVLPHQPAYLCSVTVNMSTARVLLIGGHGKISLLMTSAMLSRSWHVTSLIRSPEQSAEIESKGKGQPGKIDVVVESLEDVTSVQKAQRVLDQVKPDFVIWSAGLFSLTIVYPVDGIAAYH